MASQKKFSVLTQRKQIMQLLPDGYVGVDGFDYRLLAQNNDNSYYYMSNLKTLPSIQFLHENNKRISYPYKKGVLKDVCSQVSLKERLCLLPNTTPLQVGVCVYGPLLKSKHFLPVKQTGLRFDELPSKLGACVERSIIKLRTELHDKVVASLKSKVETVGIDSVLENIRVDTVYDTLMLYVIVKETSREVELRLSRYKQLEYIVKEFKREEALIKKKMRREEQQERKVARGKEVATDDIELFKELSKLKTRMTNNKFRRELKLLVAKANASLESETTKKKTKKGGSK